jgi:glycine/D-amino acid oxidase-like deaminating enzyme
MGFTPVEGSVVDAGGDVWFKAGPVSGSRMAELIATKDAALDAPSRLSRFEERRLVGERARRQSGNRRQERDRIDLS